MRGVDAGPYLRNLSIDPNEHDEASKQQEPAGQAGSAQKLSQAHDCQKQNRYGTMGSKAIQFGNGALLIRSVGAMTDATLLREQGEILATSGASRRLFSPHDLEKEQLP